MRELIPPGYIPELLGSASTVEELYLFKGIEEGQAEGTRMLLEISFKWRFPLFEHAASLFNWAFKRAGVKTWAEYTDIVFVHPTEAKWYILWVKGGVWLPTILGVLVGFFSSWAGIALIAVFLGAILWRIIPPGIRTPIEQFLAMLPPILIIFTMGLLVLLLPRIAREIRLPFERRQDACNYL